MRPRVPYTMRSRFAICLCTVALGVDMVRKLLEQDLRGADHSAIWGYMGLGR